MGGGSVARDDGVGNASEDARAGAGGGGDGAGGDARAGRAGRARAGETRVEVRRGWRRARGREWGGERVVWDGGGVERAGRERRRGD